MNNQFHNKDLFMLTSLDNQNGLGGFDERRKNMNKLFTKIVGAALGLTMAIGVGVAVASNSKETTPVHAADGDSPIVLDASSMSLGSTATSSTGAEKTYGGVKYIVASAKSQAVQSGATNNFTDNATMLIGKSGAFIYNSDAIPGTITKIEVYANKGASSKVSIGVSTHATAAITSAPSTWGYATTMSTLDNVYDASAAIVTGAKYFRYQVTNANNSQVQIRITYSASTKTLSSIAVKTAPTKTTGYYEGQFFDPTGLVITATYDDASTEDISYADHSSGFTFTPSTTTALTTSNTSVTIAYGGQTTSQTISVVEDVLNSVSISGTMTKTSYSTADSWSAAGLTVTGSYAGKGNVDVTSSSTFKYYSNSAMTSEVATPSDLGIGNNQTIYIKATCSGVSNSTGYSQTVSVEAAPDVVLSTSNKPYNSTSSSNTGTETVTLDGIDYNSYAAYIYNSYLSFNRSQSGAYLYNDTAFSKNIKKIVVDYNSGGSGYFTMYEGATANTETSAVSPSTSGTGKITYTFSDTNQFFKFKLTTTGTYCNINSISIYLGSAHKSLSSIAVKTAPTKTAYKANEDFAPAGLVITATYSDSTTEDIAYSSNPTAFGFSPSTITAAGNVTITYGGKTCTQAVTLVTVTNVTGVASAPTEVYQNGTIDASEVTLNVSYSDSSVGTVTADSVSIDTSAVSPSVTATATYNAATGTKTATWSVEVLKEPVYVDVSDSITLSLTGVSGTSYSSWSNKSDKSSAVYSGNNAGGNSVLQYNNATSSGLYTSTSGGKLYSVSVDWNSNTGSSGTRKLYIYGTNTKPTAISDASSATKLGEVNKLTPTTTVTDDDYEFDYLIITGCGSAVYVNSITITWKVLGTDNPMTANPTLELGKSSISVGKTTTLTVTTTPSDSDEQLDVVSNDPSVATVSGSGKNYIVTGVAVGSTTITVTGKQSEFTNSIAISVVAASKTYEDKILTPEAMGIDAYDKTDPGTYSYDDADYSVYYVMKSGGFQFHAGDGYITNAEELYSNAEIKSITLIMKSNNSGTAAVYEGTSTDPDTSVSPITTYSSTGVNTYLFNGTSTYFKVMSSSGTLYIEKIIVELADDANSILEEARLAALSILTDLSGLCGGSGSGVVTQSDWDTLTSDLAALNLSNDAKLFLKNAPRICLDNLSQGGAEIENAMAHYDACVEKFGFTPDTSLTTAQASARVISAFGIVQNSNTIAIIVIVSMISVTAIGGYFFIRKRKEQ